MLKAERAQKEALILALLEKDVSVEDIAKILDVTNKNVEKILKKNSSK